MKIRLNRQLRNNSALKFLKRLSLTTNMPVPPRKNAGRNGRYKTVLL
jgi:hypothetical protein